MHGDLEAAVLQVFDLYHNLYGSHDISLQPQDTLISVDYLTHSSYALAVWGKIFPCLHMFIPFYHAVLSLVHYDFRAYPISTRSVVMVYVNSLMCMHVKQGGRFTSIRLKDSARKY